MSGGVGGTTVGALSSIGSDLSVSVSFSIANELLLAAKEEQLSEEELVAVVLGVTVMFTALQSRLASELSRRKRLAVEAAKEDARAHVRSLRSKISSLGEKHELAEALSDEFEEAALAEAGRASAEKLSDRRGGLDFVFLIVSICSRIGVAISVQLLAQAVKSTQPSRLARTISLLSLACFFIFLESVGQRHL